MMIAEKEVDRFVFICVGKKAPFKVGVYELSSQSLREGAAAVEYTLEKYSEALKTDVWDYDFGKTQTVEIPVERLNLHMASKTRVNYANIIY